MVDRMRVPSTMTTDKTTDEGPLPSAKALPYALVSPRDQSRDVQATSSPFVDG